VGESYQRIVTPPEPVEALNVTEPAPHRLAATVLAGGETTKIEAVTEIRLLSQFVVLL
jgi:hypothetical protein